MYETYKTIFRNIYNGVGNHGDFLMAFARAYIYADSENTEILQSAAERLVTKYNLYIKPYIEVHNE